MSSETGRLRASMRRRTSEVSPAVEVGMVGLGGSATRRRGRGRRRRRRGGGWWEGVGWWVRVGRGGGVEGRRATVMAAFHASPDLVRARAPKLYLYKIS